MSTVVGQWRATYTPGDWVLLSGPTSTVLLEPPPPERSGMVDALWEEVVASSSMTDLASRLASYPLDSLPSFAAFFWTADGMRSLVRGAVSVVDLTSGVTVAEGEGIQTWSEVGLGQVSQVLVDVQTAGNGAGRSAAGGRRRTCVLGPAGRVRGGSRALAPGARGGRPRPRPRTTPRTHRPSRRTPPRARFTPRGRRTPSRRPRTPRTGPGTPPSRRQRTPTRNRTGPDPRTRSPSGTTPRPGRDWRPSGRPSRGWGGRSGGRAFPRRPEPAAELPGASTELLADPFAEDEAPLWQPDEWSPDQWNPKTAPEPMPPATAPEPFPPAPGPDEQAAADKRAGPRRSGLRVSDVGAGRRPDAGPGVAPDGAEEMENADTQRCPPPYQTATTGTQSQVSQNSLIMAVVCQYGHASAQNATTCRICGSPIAPQGPQLLPRPVLAVLRASDGSTAEVDRAVLVGRAPSAQRSSARTPRLMTVPSPGHDISRTHLEVAPEGWSVVVTDLHSTNGTILVRPGGPTGSRCRAGEAVPVELGSVMELGDGISVLVDFPQ